jgi:hypothetical protein
VGKISRRARSLLTLGPLPDFLASSISGSTLLPPEQRKWQRTLPLPTLHGALAFLVAARLSKTVLAGIATGGGIVSLYYPYLLLMQ